MILQSLWFIRPGPPGTTWLIAAGITHDLVANPDGLAAFFREWEAVQSGVQGTVRAISASILPGLELRQEWNTPPRTLTADIQPNVP